MKKLILLLCFSFYLQLSVQAQHGHSHSHNRKVIFPDVPGFITLACDFHQHTVFSDGSVWPTIRVQEALKDGLDAIAVTEHLEYQPHKEDIPHPNRNRSYQIAQKAAGDEELIIINGSEITRSMPPGHSNAIFVEDANKLLQDEPIDAFREAKKQDAFIFWNHPHWIAQLPSGMARLTDMHRKLIDEGLLNGIEVVNSKSYSAEALQIALDHNLTIMGTSDIHGLIDWEYDTHHGGHRPVTLVFAKGRSAEGIKEGLKDRRTVVWYKNLLIGKEAFLVPLIQQSLVVTEAHYQDETQILSVEISNNANTEFILNNESDFTFHAHSNLVEIPPLGKKVIQVKTVKRRSSVDLPFTVQNAITAPQTQPEITFRVSPG